MITLFSRSSKASIFNLFLVLCFTAVNSLLCCTSLLTANAESYTSICVKGHVDLIEQQVPTTPQFRTYLNTMCSCQEQELLKAGLSQADFQIYRQEIYSWGVGGKTQEEIAKIKITPRINTINNSAPVKKKCGTVFN